MRNRDEFTKRLSPSIRELFLSLNTPRKIQDYLDSLPYIAEELDRSPLRVLTDHQAHCLDGGIFAALALSQLGHRPLILDLVPEPGLDDDHVLALYQVNGTWGCLAKSNYPVLRSREPVYRTLRELAMSYFDFYFSVNKLKTLRGYTRPLDLDIFATDWMWNEAGVSYISKHLYHLKPISLIAPEAVKHLLPGDDMTYHAASLGTDFSWSYGIRKNP
jgi:hypothetical protein